MRKIRVYIIARISEDAHLWNKKIASVLGSDFDVFLPQEQNPYNIRHESMPFSVFKTDLAAMKASHIGLMLPEYGNDCAFEAGWYANSEKPLVVYIDTQLEWLCDWMVKGGVDYVLTENRRTYEALRNDPILMHKKLVLLGSFDRLGEALRRISDGFHAKP